MFTDADIEMAEMAEASRLASAGVCPVCTEALNPFHPKWASDFAGRSYGPLSVVKCRGLESKDYPGYHTNCMRDMLSEDY